ncbi:MAG: tyrosine--tRNA ligase [Rickettsiales bacterium]|jgi:tyrosyl-tRNA synthetase|nr:tyrosine--tRNA ligase [Rickettsiales bacterium]
MFRSRFLQECGKRGFLNQCTNVEELDKQLSSGRPVVAYWGTDPTGNSLHVGHLFSLMMFRLFQKCGNKVIMLVGGATGLIGDPSYKDKSRPMLSREMLEKNRIGIQKSMSKFIRFGDDETDAILVDNYDWWKDKNYIEILRDVGPHVSVNKMLSFESVKLRLEKEEHMSFLEFNYMIMQAYDFYYLYKKYGCTLQMCGADQWGNVVAGVELVRRLQFTNNEVKQGEKTEVLGFSTPLLVDSSGKKVGKSEGNAIWTNEDMLDPFEYFQYFRNVQDADVVRFLKVYTDMSVEDIEAIKNSDVNELKKILAFEATKICHGETVAKGCLEKAEQIFEKNSFEHLEVKNCEKIQSLYTLLRELGFAESNSEAKRLIRGGGIRINDEKIEDEFYNIPHNLNDFKLSIGKKKHVGVKFLVNE